MAHFAKLDNNNVVVQVIVVNNDVLIENGIEVEQKGIDFLRQIYNEPNSNWKKSSYNTSGGQYFTTDSQGLKILGPDQSKAFRKNSASIGATYDANRDAFIPKKPYKAWILNEQTCLWEPPIPFPSSNDVNAIYVWDDNIDNWVNIAQ
jgi:hypothetical protein